MSRLATLPNASMIELVERRRVEDGTPEEVAVPLEGKAHIDVSRAQSIYAIGTKTIVEVNSWRYYRFTMPDEAAACAGVEQLVKIASLGGR